MMADEYIKREDGLNAMCAVCVPFLATTHEKCDMAKCAEYCAVARVPAADVVPVRRGRWIKSPECPEQYDICSVCGKSDKHRSRGDADHPALESIPPFCKWCGAKLDKEDQNDHT